MANTPEVIDLDAEIYEANRMAFSMLLRQTLQEAREGRCVSEQIDQIEAAYFSASRSNQRMIGVLRGNAISAGNANKKAA